jgi:hypothetical protein
MGVTSTLDPNTMDLSQFRILNALTGILKFLHNVEIDFTTNVLLLSQESLLPPDITRRFCNGIY